MGITPDQRFFSIAFLPICCTRHGAESIYKPDSYVEKLVYRKLWAIRLESK